MANRWKGNIITATATTSSGTDYTGKANGAWGLNSQLQQKQGGLWSKGVGAPSAPTIGSASGGISQASVSFTGSSDTGGGTITSYTATSTPGSITGTGSSSPIVVTGLTNGTSYTFKVKATNSLGYTSVESAASNSVTPINFSPPPMILYGTSYDATSGFPGMGAYNWSSGFGTKLASPSGGIALGYQANSVAFNPVESTLSVCGTGGVDAYMYNLVNGIYSKLTAPSGGTSVYGRGPGGLCYSSNGNTLFSTDANIPSIAAWPYSSNSFGTKYSGLTLTGGLSSVSIDDTNSYILIGKGSSSPWVEVYNWSNGFGSKFSDPSTLISGYVGQVTFTKNSDAVLVASSASPYINAYAWSSSGFGAKYSNPSTLPNGYGGSVAFANNNIAVTNGASFPTPYVAVYPWDVVTGFGTKYNDPSSPMSTAQFINTVNFNSSGSVLTIGTRTPMALGAFAFSSGIGTKYANPSTAPEASITSLALNF